jgi:mercuric ion transport protein
MNDRHHIATGVVGAILAVVCCAGPVLLVALGSASLTAWFANAYYILVPAVLILLALIALLLYRRRTAAEDQVRSGR